MQVSVERKTLEDIIFYPGITMMKSNLTLKLYRWKAFELFCVESDLDVYFPKCRLNILFRRLWHTFPCYGTYQNSMLHNYMECFSRT